MLRALIGQFLADWKCDVLMDIVSMPDVRRSARDERAQICDDFHHRTIVGRTKIEYQNFFRAMSHHGWGVLASLL